jgi:hypothetical protein
MDPFKYVTGGIDFNDASRMMAGGGAVGQAYGPGAADLGALTGVTGAAGGSSGLLTTLGSFSQSFGLSLAPQLLQSLFKNSQDNAALKQQRDALKMQYNMQRAKAQRQYDTAFRATDAYNKGLVAAHNNRVEAYNVNIGLLEKEEAYAYEMAQLQAGSEVAGFLEENLDLLTNYVQSSGSLAASGISSASAKLTELKNFTGGMLKARRRLQGNAAGRIGAIIRNIEKAEMQGNAQRAAMYQQVKNKPTLRSYPSAPNLPRWKTPDSLKSKGLSFGELAPDILGTAIGAADSAGLFKGPTFKNA